MPKQAEIYLPSIATFPRDLASRHAMLGPARAAGFKTGLMLVLKGPEDTDPEGRKKQIDNLAPFTQLHPAERPSVFIMHPNMPIDGPRGFNLLNNRAWSYDYVCQSIDFASELPVELRPSSGSMVSFHLNTLVYPNDQHLDFDFWTQRFEKVLEDVRGIANYGQSKNVAVAVETLPIPEHGDTAKDEEHLLLDGKTYWQELRNPWPLFFWRDEIAKIRAQDAAIAIDISHSYVAEATIREVQRLLRQGVPHLRETYLLAYGDLEADASLSTFSERVLANTINGDIWHVNDAASIYRPAGLEGNETLMHEGVSLFEGEIPKNQLRRLVAVGLELPIKYVLEVHETDFKLSPNSNNSVNRILRINQTP